MPGNRDHDARLCVIDEAVMAAAAELTQPSFSSRAVTLRALVSVFGKGVPDCVHYNAYS
jgi:hypothetical protein